MSDDASSADGIYVEWGQRTLQVKVRLFTDRIAKGGKGFVKPRHGWFQGDVSFIPNSAHDVRSIGTEPIMFNSPEELVSAVMKAARAQGVTLLDPKTKSPL